MSAPYTDCPNCAHPARCHSDFPPGCWYGKVGDLDRPDCKCPLMPQDVRTAIVAQALFASAKQ